MPDLRFSIEGAEAVPYAASPQIVFRIAIENAATEPIRNVLLQAQIRIEPVQRRYTAEEQANLVELFGQPSQWARSVRSMLWTHANIVVKPFTGRTTVELPVACTFDFNVAATKYFHGLQGGDVPLTFLFSGSVFYADSSGALQVAQIPWEAECALRLPVDTWRRMMDLYYPNAAWLCLTRPAFDRLLRYKRERAFTTWEQTIESVLP